MKILICLTALVALQGCSFNKNDDNSIYIPGKSFNYEVVYFDEDDEVLKVDELILTVTDGFYPQRIQTAIKWTHYQTEGSDTTVVRETTGVVDDKEYFFIHPPREGDLHILSFVEFPSIGNRVLSDSTAYTKSEGTVTMAKTYKGTPITHVQTVQEYKGIKNIELPFEKTVSAYHMEASATSSLGTIYGNYYFTKDQGFVRLDYDLPDGRAISIRLKEEE